MTGYPPAPAPATPADPPTYTEVLPDRNGPAAIRWTPGTFPGSGVLTILTRRAATTYHVAELGCGWEGRAFRLTKADDSPGTDPEEREYSCFLGSNRQDRTCPCKGFTRWGHCRHLDAVEALVVNGWADIAVEPVALS